jgi:hypothetical protein
MQDNMDNHSHWFNVIKCTDFEPILARTHAPLFLLACALDSSQFLVDSCVHYKLLSGLCRMMQHLLGKNLLHKQFPSLRQPVKIS